MPKFSAFDLAQATEQVPGRFVVQLTFGELCGAYESVHPTAAAARLRKWREAFGDRGAWDIDNNTFERAAEAMSNAGYSPTSVIVPLHTGQLEGINNRIRVSKRMAYGIGTANTSS